MKTKPLRKSQEQVPLKVEDIEIQNVKTVDKCIALIMLIAVSLPFIAVGVLKADIVWTAFLLVSLIILYRMRGFIKELKQENINILNKIENLDKSKILYLNSNHKIQDIDKVRGIVSEKKADIYLELLEIEVCFVEKTGEITINIGFVIAAVLVGLTNLVREKSMLEIPEISLLHIIAYSLLLGISVGYLRLTLLRDDCNTKRWKIIYAYCKDYLSIEAEPYKKSLWQKIQNWIKKRSLISIDSVKATRKSFPRKRRNQ